MMRVLPRSRRLRLTVVLVTVLVVAFIVIQALAYGRMAPGTMAAKTPLGWTSTETATSRLRASIARSGLLVARLQTSKGTLAIPLNRLGITIDVAATVKAAAHQGRLGGPLLRLWFAPGGQVPAVVRIDVTRYQSELAALAANVNRPARDAGLRLDAKTLVVSPSSDGLAVDSVGLEREIVAQISAWRPFVGSVPTMVVTPQVTTTMAQQRADLARLYLSQPLTLRYRASVRTLTPAQMAPMLSVNTGANAAQQPLTFQNPHAERALHHLLAGFETPVANAQVSVVGKRVEVSQSHPGFLVDMPVLVADLDAAVSTGGLRDVFVPMVTVAPTLSTSEVNAMGMNGLGSQFTTYFTSPGARATNIALAARLVDGTIVEPGQVFSLNHVMGPRTVNRGFDFAPVIAAGNVLRPGVGGGICQFATTLFNAVFFAGLQVVERQAHSLFIADYPIGRDATVSWGGADFKFRNDTSKPLMIRSWVSGGSLTVVLVGTIGRQVTFTTSPFYDIRPPASSRAHPRVIDDNTLARGVIAWETGAAGQSVKVVRTVMVGGKLLFRDTFISVYEPRDWIERIGTG
ncbi:MAG: VanW family protein [Thermoleophilia bacterium]